MWGKGKEKKGPKRRKMGGIKKIVRRVEGEKSIVNKFESGSSSRSLGGSGATTSLELSSTSRACFGCVLIVLMMAPAMGNSGEVEYYHAAR